jgi:putative tryptophan/tyrosine transport system substrate-binding protein
MKRREFIAGLGSAAAWPVMARAQPSAGLPVVGLLQGRTREAANPLTAAFQTGLAEIGFVEGRNVTFEYRYADGNFDRLPGLAAELVRQRVNVIAAGTPAGLAAKAATDAIPIVFIGGGDPIKAGLVASINRPEGNVTGVTLFGGSELTGKRLELLHQLVPQVTVMGALLASVAGAEDQMPELGDAGRHLGLSIRTARISGECDFEDAFATLAREPVGALIVMSSTFFNTYRDRLVALAARYRLPAIYEPREFAQAGGLVTYAPSFLDAFRQAGIYTGRILKGEKPSELPVQLPTKFEFVVNLKTAKSLGLTVPETLLATADEVIQ